MKITKVQRNALLAISIGDGHITNNGQIIIKHCQAQEEYLQWKHNYLKSLNIKVNPIYYINNNGYPGCMFRVSTNKYTKILRQVLYPSGNKNYYNSKLLNKLSAQHIAIWYMDDGGLSQKREKGKIVGNELMLNTHTNKNNNQILINYFKEVWGINFKQYKNRGSYRLSCGTKEARKFIPIIYPYIKDIKCMNHKLNVKPKKFNLNKLK